VSAAALEKGKGFKRRPVANSQALQVTHTAACAAATASEIPTGTSLSPRNPWRTASIR
jgi:hypothetical protein